MSRQDSIGIYKTTVTRDSGIAKAGTTIDLQWIAIIIRLSYQDITIASDDEVGCSVTVNDRSNCAAR